MGETQRLIDRNSETDRDRNRHRQGQRSDDRRTERDGEGERGNEGETDRQTQNNKQGRRDRQTEIVCEVELRGSMVVNKEEKEWLYRGRPRRSALYVVK